MSKSKKNILIVEDDDFILKAYQVKFNNEDFNILVAADGTEALTYLKKEPADLVLLDLMLPGVSGFDVLAAIRKDEKWKNVPVIVLSNLGQQNDIKRCQDLGISDYIIKSDSGIKETMERIKKHLL